jgi:hypothetical protein
VSLTRTRERDRKPAPSGGSAPASEAFASTIGQEDSDLSLRSVVEGEPAGFGSEASTSSGSFGVVDEAEVPVGRQGELVEVSVAIASNGEAFVATRGLRFGPYAGAVEVAIPFEDDSLVEGDRVRVYHRSTDGNATTTRAQLTLRLF